MAFAEENHWWYKTLFRTSYISIQKCFGDKKISILDAGCGTGGFLKYLQDENYSDLNGFDINEYASQKASLKTGLTIPCCSISSMENVFENKKFDVIVCHDVLYFLDDTTIKNTLIGFHRQLNPNGIVIVNLPALQWFKGSHDHHVGIKKRYSKKDCLNFIPENYTLTHFSYRHFLISPVILLKRFYSRVFPASTSDIKPQNKLINNLLISINKPNLNFQKFSPFGSSVYFVLKRNDFF